MDNPCMWLPEVAWDNITELDKLANFHGIITSFEQYMRDWNLWYMSGEPESMLLPGQLLPTTSFIHSRIPLRGTPSPVIAIQISLNTLIAGPFITRARECPSARSN